MNSNGCQLACGERRRLVGRNAFRMYDITGGYLT